MSQHPSTRLSQVATRSSWAEPWSKLYPFQGSGGRSKYEFVNGKDDIPYITWLEYLPGWWCNNHVEK